MSNIENIKNRAWEAYKEEFELSDYEIWQWHLWAKDEVGKMLIDITEENIVKCEKLYKKSPNGDNFIRLLVLKIFAGKVCKELTSEFLNLYDKGKGNVVVQNILGLVTDTVIRVEEFSKEIKASLSKMRAFLLWFIDVRPNVLKYLIYDLEYGEYRLGPLCEFLGVHNVFRGNIDLNRILNLGINDINVNTTTGFYLVSEYCYRQKYWLEAFCLYEKARTIDEIYREDIVDDVNKLINLPSGFYGVESCPGDINSRTLECLENIIKCGDTERLYKRIKRLNSLKDEYDQMMEKYEAREKNYSRLISIFNKIMNENYKEACELWMGLSKENIKIIGLDYNSTTKFLRNLKDKRGNEKDNRKNVFAQNPAYEDKVIIDEFHRKLCEFVSGNMIQYYKNDSCIAWYKGVPEKIQQEAEVVKRESPRLSRWKCLWFSHYSKIICGKDNWNHIFRQYFIIEKADNNLNQEGLTSFLSQAVKLRNKVQHPEHGRLNREERKELKVCWEKFFKVYDSWKNRKKE